MVSDGTKVIIAGAVILYVLSRKGAGAPVPTPPGLVTIEVYPLSAIVVVEQTKQFIATPKDINGNPMSGITITWSVSDTSIGMIDQTGLFKATIEGSTIITASSGSIYGSSTVTTTKMPEVPSPMPVPPIPVGCVGLYGDINGDGIIDYKDALLVAKYITGQVTLDDCQKAKTDVDATGFTTYVDVMYITNYIIGKTPIGRVGQPIS